MADGGPDTGNAGRGGRYVVKKARGFFWRNLILLAAPPVLAALLAVGALPAWPIVLAIGGCVYVGASWMFVRLLVGPDEVMVFDEHGLLHRGFFRRPIPWIEIEGLEYSVRGNTRALRVYSGGLTGHLRADVMLLGPLLPIWFGGLLSPRKRYVDLGFADLNGTPIEAYNAARRIAPLQAPFQANHAKMLDVRERTQRTAKKKRSKTRGGQRK